MDALKSALSNMKKYFENKHFVCVSDGFFPFTDSINLLRKNGLVAQPSGSINDKKYLCLKNNIIFYKKQVI